MKKVLFLILLFLILPTKNVFSLERCMHYRTDVRIQHTKYFGIGFPYWYGVAQLQKESACRPNVTAFDAGMGIAQFMPNTANYINTLMGESLDPYNPQQAIKMQAFYMSRLHRGNRDPLKKLCWTYQAYNGGQGNLNSEFKRAGEWNWVKMKAACQRRTITLKSGQKLNFCDVNYDYSLRLWQYAKTYRIGSDGSWSYW